MQCHLGIPPHIDTHSAFTDGIVSLSLGSQVCFGDRLFFLIVLILIVLNSIFYVKTTETNFF